MGRWTFSQECAHFMFSQKVAVPLLQISNIISKYVWHYAYPFYSFKLRHLRQISKRGHSFVILLAPFDFLNRRMLVQRIRQNVWVSCRNFGGIALMRSRNIAVFRNIIYILVTRGHVISTFHRFRPIFCFLKWCTVWYGLWSWNMLSRIDSMLAGKIWRSNTTPAVSLLA